MIGHHPSLLLTAVLLLFLNVSEGRAQGNTDGGKETEFPSGWRFPLELSQGPVPTTAAYAGWLSIGAMRTVVPGHLRAGLLVAPALLGRDGTVLGGARLAWRVFTLHTPFGSWGNVQLSAEHLWSLQGTALAGGGVVVEAGERILAGLKGFWSYAPDVGRHPAYLQFSIGIDLFNGKSAPPGDDPFSDP